MNSFVGSFVDHSSVVVSPVQSSVVLRSEGFLKSRLGAMYGSEITRGSVISHEPFLSRLIEILQPQSVLEIGTFRGLSAALWAELVGRVVTIDVAEQREARDVWRSLGVEEKISYHLVRSEAEKRKIATSLDFDLAFVDGDHSPQGVRSDFDSVKHCRWVLFHDYKPGDRRYRGLVEFVDRLEPKPLILGIPGKQFALWFREPQPELAAQISEIRYTPIESGPDAKKRTFFSRILRRFGFA